MSDKQQIEEEMVLMQPVSQMWRIIHFVFVSISLFFAFKRNSGFDLGAFLAAVIMPYIYLPYALAVPV